VEFLKTMKTTRSLTLAMTMSMGMCAGLHASVTEHQPPAPLPEFKTPEQLAKWRSEQKLKSQPSASSQEAGVFYTGKPYLAESGSYAFKYREYNPEMGRWTTIDPSGFPDGANNRMYAALPTSEIDNNGLRVTAPGIPDYSTTAVSNINVFSYKLDNAIGVGANGEGYIIDHYSAIFSANVSITFNNPFNTSTDSRTKQGTGVAYATTSGLTPSEIVVTFKVPTAGIEVPVPSGGTLAQAALNTLGKIAAAGAQQTVQNVTEVVDKGDIQQAVDYIKNNPPSINTLTMNFPGSAWPTFVE
jgi:RHS repeat-associated protein